MNRHLILSCIEVNFQKIYITVIFVGALNSHVVKFGIRKTSVSSEHVF